MTDDPIILAINVTFNGRYYTRTLVSDLLFHHKDDPKAEYLSFGLVKKNNVQGNES